jgi:hypothetical protein
MGTILYAREYPIDLPAAALGDHKVLRADNIVETVLTLERNPIDAYILGMVLLKKKTQLSELEDALKAREGMLAMLADPNLSSQQAEVFPGIRDGQDAAIEGMLEYDSANIVLSYIEGRGEIGEIPILFYTGHEGVVLPEPDETKRISAVRAPIDEIFLRKWLKRNVMNIKDD